MKFSGRKTRAAGVRRGMRLPKRWNVPPQNPHAQGVNNYTGRCGQFPVVTHPQCQNAAHLQVMLVSAQPAHKAKQIKL